MHTTSPHINAVTSTHFIVISHVGATSQSVKESPVREMSVDALHKFPVVTSAEEEIGMFHNQILSFSIAKLFRVVKAVLIEEC